MSDQTINPQLILISGESASGKSASLQKIKNQPNWLYLNSEAGKRLPFRNAFESHAIDDPYQVYEAFDHGTDNPDVQGIVIDSITFLLDMYESKYIIGAANGQQAWGNFAQFFKVLMQDKVVKFGKPVIIMAHTRTELDDTAGVMRTSVPVKGSLKNNGIEAYFSTVVSTKKMPLKGLEAYKSELLNITPDDEIVGFKHCFQTRLTKQTTGERIRSPMGLFDVNQTYMDNCAQRLLDHLHTYYN